MYELDKPLWFIIGFFLGFLYGLISWAYSPLIPVFNIVFGEIIINNINDIVVLGLRSILVSIWIYPILGAILWKIRKEAIYLILGMFISSSITAFIVSVFATIIAIMALPPGL